MEIDKVIKSENMFRNIFVHFQSQISSFFNEWKYKKKMMGNKLDSFLLNEIKETEKSIQNLVKAIEQGVFTKSVKTRLDTLETVLDELKTKLIQAEIAKTLITKEMVVFYFQKFRELDFTKLENKQALVDNLVNKVILYDDRFIIFFNHNEKQATVSLDKINSSDLGTLGSPHHIPTNAYISAFVGFYFLRKLPLSIVCPLFLNMLCIFPKFWFRGVFFKPFFIIFIFVFMEIQCFGYSVTYPRLRLLEHMAVDV
jgi:hypothetical protein